MNASQSVARAIAVAFVVLIGIVPSTGCHRADEEPGQEVVVYVAVDRKDAEPILHAFQTQTDIRVRAVYDAEAAKTTGLVARLLAEANRPRCDVFWNNEIVQTLLLAERDIVQPYRSPQAETIPDQFKSPDGVWTGIATRARVLVYNTRLVPEDQAPRRLADLADARWRGKFAVANPQFGTTRTHVAALFAARGAESTQQLLLELKANDVRIVDGNAMVMNLVARAHPDASPVLVGLTDTDDVLSGQSEGQPIRMIYPDQGSDGTLIIPSTVCLIRGAPHPDSARRLIDYLVSTRTESLLTRKGTGYSAVRTGTPRSDASPAAVRSMRVEYEELLQQLIPSSQWTAENFHP